MPALNPSSRAGACLGLNYLSLGPLAEWERVPGRRGHSKYMQMFSNLSYTRSWKTMAGMVAFIWIALPL